MAIVSKQFHKHERNMGNEDFYYLARDTETGRVFVRHWWSHRSGLGGMFKEDEEEIGVAEFLQSGAGTAQDSLLALIGTLVGD